MYIYYCDMGGISFNMFFFCDKGIWIDLFVYLYLYLYFGVSVVFYGNLC